MAQHQRRPIGFTKLLQLLIQCLTQLPESHISVVFRASADRSLTLIATPSGRCAPRLACHSVGYAVQPAGNRAALADGAGSAGQDEEGGLPDILGIGLAAKPAAAQLLDHRPMPLHQSRKGALVPLLGEAREQLGIADIGSRRTTGRQAKLVEQGWQVPGRHRLALRQGRCVRIYVPDRPLSLPIFSGEGATCPGLPNPKAGDNNSLVVPSRNSSQGKVSWG